MQKTLKKQNEKPSEHSTGDVGGADCHLVVTSIVRLHITIRLLQHPLVVNNTVVHIETMWYTQGDLTLFTLVGGHLPLESGAVAAWGVAGDAVSGRPLTFCSCLGNVVHWLVFAKESLRGVRSLPSSWHRLRGIRSGEDQLTHNLLPEDVVGQGLRSTFLMQAVRVAYG